MLKYVELDRKSQKVPPAVRCQAPSIAADDEADSVNTEGAVGIALECRSLEVSAGGAGVPRAGQVMLTRIYGIAVSHAARRAWVPPELLELVQDFMPPHARNWNRPLQPYPRLFRLPAPHVFRSRFLLDLPMRFVMKK